MNMDDETISASQAEQNVIELESAVRDSVNSLQRQIEVEKHRESELRRELSAKRLATKNAEDEARRTKEKLFEMHLQYSRSSETCDSYKKTIVMCTEQLRELRLKRDSVREDAERQRQAFTTEIAKNRAEFQQRLAHYQKHALFPEYERLKRKRDELLEYKKNLESELRQRRAVLFKMKCERARRAREEVGYYPMENFVILLAQLKCETNANKAKATQLMEDVDKLESDLEVKKEYFRRQKEKMEQQKKEVQKTSNEAVHEIQENSGDEPMDTSEDRQEIEAAKRKSSNESIKANEENNSAKISSTNSGYKNPISVLAKSSAPYTTHGRLPPSTRSASPLATTSSVKTAVRIPTFEIPTISVNFSSLFGKSRDSGSSQAKRQMTNVAKTAFTPRFSLGLGSKDSSLGFRAPQLPVTPRARPVAPVSAAARVLPAKPQSPNESRSSPIHQPKDVTVAAASTSSDKRNTARVAPTPSTGVVQPLVASRSASPRRSAYFQDPGGPEARDGEKEATPSGSHQSGVCERAEESALAAVISPMVQSRDEECSHNSPQEERQEEIQRLRDRKSATESGVAAATQDSTPCKTSTVEPATQFSQSAAGATCLADANNAPPVNVSELDLGMFSSYLLKDAVLTEKVMPDEEHITSTYCTPASSLGSHGQMQEALTPKSPVTAASSPLDFEKHMERLRELKKSPEYRFASRRIFESAVATSRTADEPAGRKKSAENVSEPVGLVSVMDILKIGSDVAAGEDSNQHAKTSFTSDRGIESFFNFDLDDSPTKNRAGTEKPMFSFQSSPKKRTSLFDIFGSGDADGNEPGCSTSQFTLNFHSEKGGNSPKDGQGGAMTKTSSFRLF